MGVLEKEIDTLELLPHFRDSVKGKEELVSRGGIRFIPQYDQPNFLTVASINIDDENEPMKRETIMGGGGYDLCFNQQFVCCVPALRISGYGNF